MARQSLTNFAPQRVQDAKATDATIEVSTSVAAATKTPDKYPKLSVYLTTAEIRTLKLIAIDSDQKVSDICSTAIREWLERNGHARGKVFKA